MTTSNFLRLELVGLSKQVSKFVRAQASRLCNISHRNGVDRIMSRNHQAGPAIGHNDVPALPSDPVTEFFENAHRIAMVDSRKARHVIPQLLRVLPAQPRLPAGHLPQPPPAINESPREYFLSPLPGCVPGSSTPGAPDNQSRTPGPTESESLDIAWDNIEPRRSRFNFKPLSQASHPLAHRKILEQTAF
jgi:hypothetical protein